ncbi:MAG TPA: carbohydrate binding domain-containing protein [Planctomycetota bacterium]|nr:carbohydrate binding domain-containing protein [Planctomycetota bacterium]
MARRTGFWWLVVLLAGCGGPRLLDGPPPEAEWVVEDFDRGVADWANMSNVAMPPKIEARSEPGARGGVAQVTFAANDKGWTNLHRPVEWPAEADAVALDVRSAATARFKIKLNEMKRGLNHNAYEGFAAIVEAGPAWKRVTLPLSGFLYSWGHADGNHQVDRDRISGLGFEQEDLARPVDFWVDRIALVRLAARSIVVDDFEGGISPQWKRMDSGSMQSDIFAISAARLGTGAARIEFSGSRSPGSWTDFYRDSRWPTEGGVDTVCLWARSDRPARVMIKVNQGLRHDDLEMYGKTLELGPEWRRYRIPLSEFRELIFSHAQQDGGSASGMVDPKQILGVGFAEPADAPLPLVFYVDQLELEASR